jgi:hypothetical protein
MTRAYQLTFPFCGPANPNETLVGQEYVLLGSTVRVIGIDRAVPSTHVIVRSEVTRSEMSIAAHLLHSQSHNARHI